MFASQLGKRSTYSIRIKVYDIISDAGKLQPEHAKILNESQDLAQLVVRNNTLEDLSTRLKVLQIPPVEFPVLNSEFPYTFPSLASHSVVPAKKQVAGLKTMLDELVRKEHRHRTPQKSQDQQRPPENWLEELTSVSNLLAPLLEAVSLLHEDKKLPQEEEIVRNLVDVYVLQPINELLASQTGSILETHMRQVEVQDGKVRRLVAFCKDLRSSGDKRAVQSEAELRSLLFDLLAFRQTQLEIIAKGTVS